MCFDCASVYVQDNIKRGRDIIQGKVRKNPMNKSENLLNLLYSIANVQYRINKLILQIALGQHVNPSILENIFVHRPFFVYPCLLDNK